MLNEWILLPTLTKLWDIIMFSAFIAFILGAIGIFISIIRPKKITSKNLSMEFDNQQQKEECEDEEVWSLFNHKFFRTLESQKNTSTYYHTTIITNKDAVNISFLRDCVFRILHEEIYSFIKEAEKTNGKNLNTLPVFMNHIIDTYEEYSKTIKIELPNGKIIFGVPLSYINKFNNWNSDHVKVCLENIDSVISDKLYTNWKYKASTLLEHLYILVKLILLDASKTLKQLNGDLDKEVEEKVKKL